jgi:hypothetical protein
MVMPTRNEVEPLPIDLRVPLVDGLPTQQRRWTIAIRLILLIPQFILLFFLFIAAFFVTIVGWFAALVAGRLPGGIRTFLIYVLRWDVRVMASATLMTDVYPPFSGDEDDLFPISLGVPDAASLNRLAVLFRIILVVPASFLYSFFQSGLAVFLFPFWIAALVLGRLPDPVFRMMAIYVRFVLRVHAYFMVVTPCYPWGWKGDPQDSTQRVSPVPPSTPAVATAQEQVLDAKTGTGLPAFPTPEATLGGGESGDFDFTAKGWTQGWVYIVLAAGFVEQFRTYTGGSGHSAGH